MSWLSEGLAKIGISKNTQRAVTKPILAAAAPFTGGASAALIPFVRPPSAGSPPSAIEQGFAAAAGQVAAQAPLAAAQGFGSGLWAQYKVPISIGITALIVGIGGFIFARK